MQVTGIDCPFCGAPVTLKAGHSKGTCDYCSKEFLIESKMAQDFGEKVSNTLQENESKTQLEIRRLQASQEMSMLQMQLSNLRTEKRRLERDNSRQANHQRKRIYGVIEAGAVGKSRSNAFLNLSKQFTRRVR